jgi:hypothetical protein
MKKKSTLGDSSFDSFMPSTHDGANSEDFYSDDVFEEVEERPRKPIKRFLFPAALAMVATAMAANISFGGGQSVEFGQGILNLKACTPSLTLSPVVGFVNEGEAKFVFEAVDITGIPDSCIGYDFLIRVYDESTQAPLMVTDSADNDSIQVDYVRFSMLPDREFAIVGSPNAYLEILDTSTALDNQVAVVYDAGGLAGDLEDYADARNAFRITVETFPTLTASPSPSPTTTSTTP